MFFNKLAIQITTVVLSSFPVIAFAQTPSDLPSTLKPVESFEPASNLGLQVTTTRTSDDARLKAGTKAPQILAEQPLSFSDLDALKQKAKRAIFVVKATQNPAHELAATGFSFDGACVALRKCPEVVGNKAVASAQATNTGNPHSVFGRGLDRVSSPFGRESETVADGQGSICYLTTADWLTNSQKVAVVINHHEYPAEVALRDDQQNVIVLRTAQVHGVEGLEVAPYDAPQSPFVYALTNPGGTFENFSTHSFVIEQPHLYAMTSLAARNGYPLINSRGQVVGLAVAPAVKNTRATAVHYGLIDRALYADKYDRTVTETSEFHRY